MVAVRIMSHGVQFLLIKIPVRDCTIAKIFAEQDIQCPDDVSHHTITDHNDALEARENLTDVLC
jgi:hypothetical protein